MSTDVSFGNTKRWLRVAFSEQPSLLRPRFPHLPPWVLRRPRSSPCPPQLSAASRPWEPGSGSPPAGLELGGFHRASDCLAPCPALRRARHSGALGVPSSPAQAIHEKKPSQQTPQTKSNPGHTGPARSRGEKTDAAWDPRPVLLKCPLQLSCDRWKLPPRSEQAHPLPAPCGARAGCHLGLQTRAL